MNMISDCSYCGLLELRDSTFLLDTVTLLVVVAPAAIVSTLWRIFVTNTRGPRGDVLILGLDESSSIYTDLSPSAMPLYLRVMYLSTAILTFMVGLLTSKVLNFIRQL